MRLDVKRIAVEYYFGDLQYRKLPRIALNVLEEGYDGAALRRIAGFADRSSIDIREDEFGADEIDSTFREMGIDAPISKDQARLTLAAESARRVMNGASDLFDEARYIHIRLCELSPSQDVPADLSRIVDLAKRLGTPHGLNGANLR